MSGWPSLQTLLEWPADKPLPKLPSRLPGRLVAAVQGLASGKAGAGDVAALLRQAMIEQQIQSKELGLWTSSVVTVPESPPWPDPGTWEAHGLSPTPAGDGQWSLQAMTWQPTWLDSKSASAVDEATACVPRRGDRRVPADPLLRSYLPKYDSYASPGQREAVYAAFFTRENATIIVNLPTGSGKTLAFQLPALAAAADQGLVLVIMPTVALALDQAARFAELADSVGISGLAPLAYHSGLSEDEKRQLRHAIREGKTPIVFASPEAALGTLRGPLLQAAAAGRLRLFAVDEAHVVAAWGNEFRPEFQALVGLRDALRQAACQGGRSFRTLLLSATVSSGVYELLVDLFGDGKHGSVDLVAEVSLRPEPAYLLSAASSDEEREERVLEALRFLPRPLLLYTSRRKHARAWERLLRDHGVQRVASVIGGDMNKAAGAHVLERWRAGDLDVIVATSAFGLGMDQSDVRSVVHACVPENIDRYYQEVGRGGRDGQASVALLLSGPEDLRQAKDLAAWDPIGVPRVRERWKAMFSSPQHQFKDGLHVLPLDALPSNITHSSALNRSWNLRVLAMMVRAGIIAFAAGPPPLIEQSPGESDNAFKIRRKREFKCFASKVGVRVLLSIAEEEPGWGRVEGILHERKRTEERISAQIDQLTVQTRPLHETLAEAYEIPQVKLKLSGQRANCPLTREGGQTATSHSPKLFPAVIAEVTLRRDLSACHDDWRDAQHVLWVRLDPRPSALHERDAHQKRLEHFLARLAARGVVAFHMERDALSPKGWKQMVLESPRQGVLGRPLMAASLAASLKRVPTLVLLPDQPPTDELRKVVQFLREHRQNPCFVLVPPTVGDPERPDRTLLETRPNHAMDHVDERLS